MASDAVGVSPPPPGVAPNFTNPHSIGYRIIVASVLFPALTIPIGFLRLYTKRYIVGTIHTDDYLIVVATICALGLSALNCYQTTNGLGLHIWDVTQDQYTRLLKVGGLAGPLFYNIATLFTKTSLCFFYLRFSPFRAFTYMVYATTAVAITYCLLAAFAFTFLCNPIQKYWEYSTPGSCLNIDAFGISMSAANVATDITLLLLPLCIIWSLHKLPLRQKVILAFILMAGSFVCIVSIIRLKVVIQWSKEPQMDWTTITVNNFIWVVVETWCGILCAHLPNLRGFIRKYFPKIHGGGDEANFSQARRGDLESDQAPPPPDCNNMRHHAGLTDLRTGSDVSEDITLCTIDDTCRKHPAQPTA